MPRWFARPRFRRTLFGIAILCGPLLLIACIPILTRGPASVEPAVRVNGGSPQRSEPLLSVMTMNVAHGRAEATNQFFCSGGQIRANLDAIAGMIRREAPDVLALQEADGPSFWSGGFDHVAFLAERSGMACFVQAENVRGLGLSYGTALLSNPQLSDPRARTFEPTWPTFSKGFIAATIGWPGAPDITVDIVSAHLDYSSHEARLAQVRELMEFLRGRSGPLVLMGDFNCGWNDPDSPLRLLARELDLHAYEPTSDQATFPGDATRLDWILLSADLEFESHRVLSDRLSDHLPVAARIRLEGR